MAHSPEPWSVKDDDGWLRIDCANGFLVEWPPAGWSAYGRMDQEDAERSVACVNACRGIPTEKLEFVWDALFTAMMSADGTARRGGEPSHYDLMVVYSDCLNAARAMAHAGVNLTELLKRCRLERLDG